MCANSIQCAIDISNFCGVQIDLGLADVPMVIEQMRNAFGFGEDEVMKVIRFRFDKCLSIYSLEVCFFVLCHT